MKCSQLDISRRVNAGDNPWTAVGVGTTRISRRVALLATAIKPAAAYSEQPHGTRRTSTAHSAHSLRSTSFLLQHTSYCSHQPIEPHIHCWRCWQQSGNSRGVPVAQAASLLLC
jgi:hypothetical protein